MSQVRPLTPTSEERQVELDGAVERPVTAVTRTPDPHDDGLDHNNVIDTSQQDNTSEASSPSPIQHPLPLSMPKITDLSNLTLHSPSHIVGTPFAVNTSRYEYPFPETASSSSSGSGDEAFSISRSLPSMTLSTLSLSPPLTGFPAISQSPPSDSVFPPVSKDVPRYSHSKLLLREVDKEPPVPPGLLKKRNRWSMGLLARRKDRTSESSLRSATSSESIDSISATSSSVSSPQETPDDEAAADSHIHVVSPRSPPGSMTVI